MKLKSIHELKLDEKRDQVVQVLSRFYEKVFDDLMIGFYFKNKELSRLIEKETEFTLRVLGEDVEYTGMGMRGLHFPFRIPGGHFDRRQILLKEALSECDFPKDGAALWLKHNESLRHLITPQSAGQCHDLKRRT